MPPAPQLAAQSCEACRKAKRRCTRELPQCTLCTRLTKECTYAKYFAANQPSQVGAGDSTTVVIENGAVVGSHIQPSSNALFLDKQLFSSLDHQLLSPTTFSLPTEACKQLHQNADDICAIYFATTHTWLPILSRTHFRNALQDARSQARDSLLLLCMKLFSSSITGDLSHYQTARTACSAATVSGAISLRLVQSLVLLAVFEIGHGIYPAAYLTVGNAGRIAAIMGLRITKHHKQQSGAPPETWRLREEKRRLWWAIFLLDRIVNIGDPELPFVIPDPTSNDVLPANDLDWDEGRIGSNEAFLSLQRHLIPVDGSFTKTVQAAYMLGKVLRHIGQEQQRDLQGDELLNEAIQMSRVLESMNRCFEESLPYENSQKRMSWNCKLNAMSLCSTARSLLYGHYAGNETSTEDALLVMEMNRVATEGIDHLTDRTVPMLVNMNRQSLADSNLASSSSSDISTCLSPLSCHFFYQASKLLGWLVRERHDAHLHHQLQDVVKILRATSDIWNVGESYMRLLEQSKVLEQIGWNE